MTFRNLFFKVGLNYLAISCVAMVWGQSPTISQIGLSSDAKALEVNLSSDVSKGPASCSVVEVETETLFNTTCIPDTGQPHTVVIAITSVRPAAPPAAPPTPATFNPAHSYSVVLAGITFQGTPKMVPVLQGLYTPPKPLASTKGPACFLSNLENLFTGQLTSPQGSATPDMTFTGQTTHSAGGDFQGTYNLKTDLSGRCETGKVTSRIGPSLNLQGGNDPNGTPDSLNFSFLWSYPIHEFKGSKILQSINMIQTGTFESTQDFLQKDIIYSLDFKVVSQAWKIGKLQTYLYPDIGLEAGKNLRGVLPQINGRDITRLKAGVTNYIIFDSKLPWLQDIILQTSWTRRWIMIPEVTYKTNKTGPQFSSIAIGTGPRDYVNPALTFDLTKWLGLTASYEYGSLPPKYQYLDSKFTFGLTIKASFKSSSSTSQ